MAKPLAGRLVFWKKIVVGGGEVAAAAAAAALSWTLVKTFEKCHFREEDA